MNDFMEKVTLARPRFSAEERVGTMVLKAMGLSGKGIDVVRKNLKDAYGRDIRGRWPVARMLLEEIMALDLVVDKVSVQALPKDDEAVAQLLRSGEDKMSALVLTDDGKAMFEIWDRTVLLKLPPPYTVRTGSVPDSLLVVQPISALRWTGPMAQDYLDRMMLT